MYSSMFQEVRVDEQRDLLWRQRPQYKCTVSCCNYVHYDAANFSRVVIKLVTPTCILHNGMFWLWSINWYNCFSSRNAPSHVSVTFALTDLWNESLRVKVGDGLPLDLLLNLLNSLEVLQPFHLLLQVIWSHDINKYRLLSGEWLYLFTHSLLSHNWVTLVTEWWETGYSIYWVSCSDAKLFNIPQLRCSMFLWCIIYPDNYVTLRTGLLLVVYTALYPWRWKWSNDR